MARIKNMLEIQKAIIHALQKAGKTQNKIIAVQVECSQSTISKITRWTCSKLSNCGSKCKTTPRGEHHLNRILISNRFANCSEISEVWNNAGVVVLQLVTLWRFHQLRYDSRIPILKRNTIVGTVIDTDTQMWSYACHSTLSWPWFYDYHMGFWLVCWTIPRWVWKIRRWRNDTLSRTSSDSWRSLLEQVTWMLAT